jgi:hypothetical protein
MSARASALSSARMAENTTSTKRISLRICRMLVDTGPSPIEGRLRAVKVIRDDG